jgi:hypothetical protein
MVSRAHDALCFVPDFKLYGILHDVGLPTAALIKDLEYSNYMKN